jgi:hypothetical protein
VGRLQTAHGRMLHVGRLQTAHGTRVTHRRDARLEAGRVR